MPTSPPRPSRPRSLVLVLLLTIGLLTLSYASAPPQISPDSSTTTTGPTSTSSSPPTPSSGPVDPLDPFASSPELLDFPDLFAAESDTTSPLAPLPAHLPAPDNSKWLAEITDRVLVQPGPDFALPDDAVDVGGGWFSVPDSPDLDSDPDLVDREPIRWVEGFDVPTPPAAAWGLSHPADHDVDAPAAWARSRGRGVVVAVIDSGVDINHPSLRSAIWTNSDEICSNGRDDDNNGFIDDCHGWNFAAASPHVYASPASDSHGTHIAGIIAASPTSRVAGLAPSAKIMVVKFMDGSRGRTDHAAAAINYAVANGADVLNLSWGSAQPSAAVSAAIANAVSKGVAVFIAAGNHGADLAASPIYPAASAPLGAAAIAAHDPAGRLASFSAYGSGVAFSAPGVGIVSTLPAGSVGSMSGTSMATPFAAAAAALYLEDHPSASPSQVVAALTSSTAPRSSMAGRLRSGGILKAAAALGVSQPPPQVTISVSESAAAPNSPLTVTASATSYDGHDLDVSIRLPHGATVPGPSATFLAPASTGTHHITAVATDSRNQTGEAQASFVVSDLPGDFFSSPLPFPTSPATFDTTSATATSIDSSVCVPFGASLFFSLDNLGPGTHTISTAGSDFDTVLALFDSNGRLLACNDDVSTGLVRHSVLTFDLSSSTRGLRLAAGGYNADSGSLRLARSDSAAPSPVLSGPDQATEGDTVVFTAPPGTISVPALNLSGPSPLEVTFTSDGIYAVHFTPAATSSISASLTVSVANAAPRLEPRVADGRLVLEVSDPGRDRVSVSISSLSGAEFEPRTAATPSQLSWPLPDDVSGWLIITAIDEDGAVTSAPVLLGSGSTSPGLLPSPSFSPGATLSLVEASGDVDADGRPDRLRLSPSFDGAVLSAELASGVTKRYVDETAQISALTVRALCAGPGTVVLVQADSASTVVLLRLPYSSGRLGPPRTAATLSLSALQVTGCRLSGSGLTLDTLSGPRHVGGFTP